MAPEEGVSDAFDWWSAGLVALWLIVSLGVWRMLYHIEPNLIYSGGLTVVSYAACAAALRNGAGTAVKITMRNGWICFAFFAVLITAFTYTSILAGDWGPVGSLETACIGSTHYHHLHQTLIWLPLMLWSVCFLDKGNRMLAAVTIFLPSALSFLLAFLSGIEILPFNKSFVLVNLAYGIYFSLISLRIRYGNQYKLPLQLLIGVTLGALLAIHLNGWNGIMKDLVVGGKVPSTFILFNDSTCQANPPKSP